VRPGVDGGGGVPGRAGGVAQGFSAEELEAFIDAADEGLDVDLIGWAVVLVLTVLSPGIATLLTIGAPGSGNFVDRVSVLPVVFVAAFVFLGWGRLLAWTLMRALREVADSLSRAVRTLPLLLVAFLFFFYNAELWQLGVAWTVWRAAAVAAQASFFGVLVFAGFLFLGLVSIPEATITAWTSKPPAIVELGPVNIPGALVKVSWVLGAFASLYMVTATAADKVAREEQLGPITAEVRGALNAAGALEKPTRSK